MYLTATAQQIAAIVRDSSHPYSTLYTYGTIAFPSEKSFPIPDTEISAVTSIALCRSDENLVAIGTEDGTVQISRMEVTVTELEYEIWERSRIAREAIAALEFVSPPTWCLASLVALSRDGNLIAVDVVAVEEANDAFENETTSLLSSGCRSSSGSQGVTYRVQSPLKLADATFGGSEQPTGALVVLEDNADNPLVLLGMSGGTLLTLVRQFDDDGYTWTCVKKLSLPSTVYSLALSSQGAHRCSQYTMLAAGLGVSTSENVRRNPRLHLTSHMRATGWRSRVA